MNVATSKSIIEIKCGYKTTSGRPCNNPAGMGTGHVGIGYCHYHDGESETPAGRHLPLLQLLDPGTRPMVVAMIEDDKQLFDLRFELAVLKAKFAMEIAKDSNREVKEDGNEVPGASTDMLIKASRAITGAVKTLYDLERSKHLFIHVSVLEEVLGAVGETARVYLDDDKRRAFSKDLKNQIRRLLPDLTARGIAASALVVPIDEGLDKH